MNGLKNSRNLASEPKDTYKIAYILHFFLGAGNLLPWNALITAIDYFGYLYPNKHVEKVFSVAYMASSLCILGVLLSWDWCRKRLSFRLRMNLGFSMFVLSLMLTPIMHWIWHGNGLKMKSSMGYNLVVATVVICGLADGLIAGSLIGTAGKLPRQYMQAIFAGTASSGMSYNNVNRLNNTINKTLTLFYFLILSDSLTKHAIYIHSRQQMHLNVDLCQLV